MGWFYPDTLAFPNREGTSQAQTEIGLRFTLAAPASVTGLRWRRHDTTAGIAPEILRIWRVSDQTEVLRATSINDSGLVGWQECAIAAPVTLAAGDYVVSGAFQTNQGWPSADGSTHSYAAAADPRFSGGSTNRAYHTPIGAWGYTQNFDASNWTGVDVQLGAASPAGTGDAVKTGDLADWFDPVSATKPDSVPKLYPDVVVALNAKITRDGVTWDDKIGPLHAYGTASADKGVSAGVEIVRAAVADVRANLPSTSGLATAAALAAAVTAINTHTDADEAAINAHADANAIELDARIDTHDGNVRAAIASGLADTLAEVDAKALEVENALDADKDTIVTAVEAAQAAIGAGINAHDAGVKGAIADAQTAVIGSVNDHADANTATITGAIATHDTTVTEALTGLGGAIADAQTTVIGSVNDHADANTTTITGAIATHDTTVTAAITGLGGALTDATDAVNAHTDGAVTAINANTDANVNGLGVLLSGEHATAAAANAAEHVALTALLTGETGLLAVVTAITSAIAAVAGVLADAITILNALRGGSGSAHQTATADFADSPFLFAQPGDYYEVEITAWSIRQGATALPVGKWVPYAGWCAPLYGDVYGPKQSLHFTANRVTASHGATGLLIYSKAGVQGHARAFAAS